ncbi:MAG TPA: tetratricopeptide repeat protein [Pyrinomonadaceae bacterium]
MRYEFDEYSLLTSERLLLKGGERVALKPKVFETLLALVRNPGRLLSKEELIGLIWPDSFVEVSNLSQNIFTLRRALGESPQDHRFIVTVPGYGYRFVAKVRELEEGEGPRRKTPKDVDVYQTYVKGRFFWDKRTEEGLRVALSSARAVLEAEPGLPLGHVALADCYLLMGEFLYLSPGEAFPPAREAARRALALDPALGEAHASMAEYVFFYGRDWAGAERFYRDAIRLSPDYAGARHWYTWFLIAMGRYEDAAEQIRQAQMIDPGSLVLNTIVGLPDYYTGRYEQAIKQFRGTLEIEPNYHHARYYLGSALVHAGRPEEAVAEFEAMVAADPLQQAIALLGYCYAVSGRREEAGRMLSRLDELERQRFVAAYVRAFIHIGLGERERALDQLERAYEEQELWLVFLNVDPFFRGLRDEPRFTRLLERLRFKG